MKAKQIRLSRVHERTYDCHPVEPQQEGHVDADCYFLIFIYHTGDSLLTTEAVTERFLSSLPSLMVGRDSLERDESRRKAQFD
jgi:hypothetical protein